MYRVGVCGHFGGKMEFLDGQTVKTKTLTDELQNIIGVDNVIYTDTFQWKKRPLKLISECISLCKRCKNIIILPAHNGVKVFVPLFALLNLFFHKKVFYVVIGGWLPEFVEENKWLLSWLNHMEFILVETSIMSNKLTNLGLKNVSVLPNFKQLNILKEKEMPDSYEIPFKLCTFSRVMKEKGIEDAIEVVTKINSDYNRVMYTLDIYGQIDDNYQETFDKVILNAPSYIKYNGVVEYDKTVEVLKNYYLLLFPTYYSGEGFAGTLLDAFSSGVPVIASDWRYNKEIIKNMSNGLIFPTGDNAQFEGVLTSILNNKIDVISMKKQCLVQASKFESKNVIKELIKHFS